MQGEDPRAKFLSGVQIDVLAHLRISLTLASGIVGCRHTGELVRKVVISLVRCNGAFDLLHLVCRLNVGIRIDDRIYELYPVCRSPLGHPLLVGRGDLGLVRNVEAIVRDSGNRCG